jgi:hypothetical protein
MKKIAVDGQFALGNIAGHVDPLPTTRGGLPIVRDAVAQHGVHLY